MFEHKCNKNNEGTNTKDQCECKNAQGLFVPVRQVSWIVASIILANFCLFMGGYFLGQKNAITTFSNKLEQESFGDQIYSSMCALCDSQGETEETETAQDEQVDGQLIVAQDQKPTLTSDQIALGQTIDADKTSTSATAGKDDNESDRVCNDNDAGQDEVQSAQYFAQLVGFGTARAAQQFAHRLSLKEIPVIVRKRQSRTARGRFISWYQVVTEKFDDRTELEAIIEKIEGEEKLNDVRIITC